ncbi:MAG: PIN domain-containing protein [Bacilli bacterium]|nr:PIN domain-containing protein [Bacilli bacterium]
MKVFFDTNVIIDALTERENSSVSCRKLLKMAASGQISGYLCSKQITDIYYVLRRYIPAESTRQELIKTLIEIFTILPLGANDLLKSLSGTLNDYEDSVLDSICKTYCMDYLVTSNIGDFCKSSNVVIKPSDLLELEKIAC